MNDFSIDQPVLGTLWLLVGITAAVIGFDATVFTATDRVDVIQALLIGLDGARPKVLPQSNLPILQRPIRESTVCWRIKAVKPDVIQVNWASMLCRSTPTKTGVERHPVEQLELDTQRVSVLSVFEVEAERIGGVDNSGFFSISKS